MTRPWMGIIPSGLELKWFHVVTGVFDRRGARDGGAGVTSAALETPMTDPTPPPRRRTARWLLVVVAVVLLAPVVAAIALALRLSPSVESGTILEIRLEGALAEATPDNPLAAVLGSGGKGVSLAGLRRIAEQLGDDKKVSGVLLEVGPIQSGLASVDEAREAIARIRAAQKPVYAVLVADFVEEKDYLLATAADRVILSPEAAALLNGFVAESPFLRGTLDKLHVEPMMFQYKEYKSAAETFMSRGMSEPAREALDAVLQTFYRHFVSVVAERRGVTETTLRALFDRGGLTAREALEAKLVDELGYPADAEAALRKVAGVDSGKPKRLGGGAYLGIRDPSTRGEAIAVVYGVGGITASAQGSPLEGETIHGPATAEAIRDAAEDDDVKAIVFRVNSPGGSAVGSDFVWKAIKDARVKKPVVVSMGDVAGSGGYWVSMGADAIVAHPTTITGSIGVVGGKFNLRGLFELGGASVDAVKVGANADLLSSFRNFDEAQADRFRAWMGQVYDDFVRRAAEGRQLAPEALEPLAHGRIWSGEDAKQRKLVDELGGFERARELAKEKAKIAKDAPTHLVRFPREKGFMAALTEGRIPGVRLLSGEVSASQILEDELRELETVQPWALAPTLRIH
jgi:protease IV